MAATIARGESCTPEVAKVVSVQGKVEIRQANSPAWTAVELDQVVCPGETIRVLERSRAALYLDNGTVMRLDQRTSITLPPKPQEASTWLNLIEGVAHFISRIKQSFEVVTPFVNAAVEGTEFVVAVGERQTDVTVFEGHVRTKNPHGELLLASGESSRTLADQAPALRVLLHPRDAVQWAPYYPPVTDYRRLEFGDVSPPWSQHLQRSVELYRRGDAAAALDAVQDLPGDLKNADVYAYRAALLLGVGRVDQASADLRRALDLAPEYGDAMALEAVIALVNDDTAQALSLAQRAVDAGPQAVAPYLALSYARQSQFDIAGALQAAQAAVTRGPDDALAKARVAELYLAQGRLEDAVSAAQQAASLDPALGRAQGMVGFVYLTRMETARAERSFQRAIQLDQADPLPRLGLGLARIRGGELEEGRRQIEFAASLDPNNALIRSYLGKAYYEERRDKLAASQLGMAKGLDPKDPTPWLYDAIVKQSSNRPVEALHDLQTSVELNDNRAVYRSRLLLDGDAAARSADLARGYQDLGFDRAALLQGWTSLNTDPGNDAAHRFLADAYATLPRYQVARVSELLQAQLLQPINIVPVSPQLAEADLAGQESAGMSLASLNEYSPLFARDGAALRLSGIVGNRGMRGDEVVLSGIQGRVSYSLGQFHHDSNGFRENDDLKQDVYDAFAQINITRNFSTQLEYRQRKSDSGDLQQLFDPTIYDASLRDKIDAKTSRLGIHYAPSPAQDVLGSVIYSEIADDQQAGVNDLANSHGTLAELQHIWRAAKMKSVVGLGYLEQHNKEQLSLVIQPGGFIFPLSDQVGDIEHRNAYVYTYLPLMDAATLSLGLSYDSFDDRDQAQISSLKRNQYNPKAGLVWRATSATTLRLAAFRAMKRPLLANQTIEPTQIAGFNQFYDDTNATDAKLYGIGLDHYLSRDLFVGAEASRRKLMLHFFDTTLGALVSQDRKESLYRAYAYWTPRNTLGLSAEYRLEDFSRPMDGNQNFADPYDVTLQSLPLGIAYYHPDGFFARWTSTYVQQDINFGTGTDKGSADFWISGLVTGYRLSAYRGLISVRIDNVFDKNFKFQSVNFGTGTALPPVYPPSRQLVLELRLWFR